MSTISLRPTVAEGAAPFVELFGSGLGDVRGLLTEAVVQMSSLQEEGLTYSPLLFIAADAGALLETLHGSDLILVGRRRNSAESVQAALKLCAPLGEGRRWAVFVLLSDKGAEFGLFRPQGSPLEPTSFELLRRARGVTAPIVGMARLRSRVVEVRGSNGLGRFFDLSGAAEEAASPGTATHKFVTAVTCDCDPSVRSRLEAFYYRIVVEILAGGHGALGAVMPKAAHKSNFLSDGNWFAQPVDLQPWIQKDGGPDAAYALLAYAQLIRRMMVMDGVTVFGSDGTVRAYNCFIHDPNLNLERTHVLGGARRRAFEHLRSQVGTELSAALYRSQDGWVECDAVPDGR